MNVSPSFALPIRVIAPYFVIATVSYTASPLLLFFLSPSMIDPSNVYLIGTIHLFLLGFVMMSIIGSMGQLSAVVAEVYHRYPKVFIWISPLFSLGIALLVGGFWIHSSLLTYGSALVLVALALFAFNLFITLFGASRRTAVTRSMQWSTLFLMIGLLIGVVMALGYAGVVDIDPKQWLFSHLMFVLGGYVLLTIMGVSTVLLPMFGACNRPSEKSHSLSFISMILSMIFALIAGFFALTLFKWIALVLAVSSLLLYDQSVMKIFLSRQRPSYDIWEKSIVVAFISLAGAIIVGISGIIIEVTTLLLLGFWLLFGGFFGFLIIGHLYKIVPFLVWFEHYAPLIEEQSVPTLQQLLPQTLALWQWRIALIGVIAMSVALVSDYLWFWYGSLLLWICSGMIFMTILLMVILNRRNFN